MNSVPLPQVCEIEKLRREITGCVVGDIPDGCYAIRTSRTGEVTYLTEEEYNNLINGAKSETD